MRLFLLCLFFVLVLRPVAYSSPSVPSPAVAKRPPTALSPIAKVVRHHGVVQITTDNLIAEDFSQVAELAAVVRAFPRERLFRETWFIDGDKYERDTTLLYDRAAKTLKYYQSAPLGQGLYREHHLYTGVSDKFLMSLGQKYWYRGNGNWDCGFGDLSQYGCGHITLASYFYSEENVLSIRVKPQQTKIRVGHPFNLTLLVANTYRNPHSFQVMSCSWNDQWKSSDPRLFSMGWPCKANFPRTITLASGATYQRILPMSLANGVVPGPISFAMGFTPIGSKQTYWSRPITLEVIK